MDSSMSSSQLESEISRAPYSICNSATRIITLEPFRKAQHSFLKWNENKPFLLEESPNNNEKVRSKSMSIYDGNESARASSVRSKRHSMFRTIEDESCLLVKGHGTILTTSEDAVLPAEKAKMRVLAVLKSYLHNLENGTLVTGDKVDTGVVRALRDLLVDSSGQAWKPSKKEYGDVGKRDDVEAFEKSDEEGVIDELRRYEWELIGNNGRLDRSVAEALRAILDWTRG